MSNPDRRAAANRPHAHACRLPARCAGALLAAGLVLAASLARAQSDDALECVVMPYRVLDLSSGVSGRLDSVHVERAGEVRAGQVLAELESRVERATLALARARAGMNSELELRRAGVAFDERRRERLNDLHARKVASAQEKEEAERAAEIGRWQVAVAQDNLRLAALEARRAEALLALRHVTSPFDGVVVERFKSPGEYVDEEPIVRVAQLDPLRVEVIVPLERYDELAPGMTLEVRAESEPYAPWHATVTAVDAVGDPASGTLRARLELPNPDRARLAGVKCTASLPAPGGGTTVDGIAVAPGSDDPQTAPRLAAGAPATP